MALGDLLIRCTLGRSQAPPHLDLALYRGDTEITTGGYRRFRIAKGAWRVNGAKASIDASFGPFAARTSFDALVLHDGDNQIDRVEIGATDVPAGMSFTPTAGFTIG